MVVLTIVTQQNGESISFEEPLPGGSYARLLSCSFFNSWHNLSRVGRMFFKGTDNVVASLPQGHYNVESIVKELQSSFERYKKKGKLVLETNNPNSVLKITTVARNALNTTQAKEVSVDYSLANFLGIGRNMRKEEYIKKLNSPSCYFIHCNLIDSTKNFLNGMRSDLAKVDVRGKPYEKVSYNINSSQNVFRDASTDKFINCITLKVKVENGELFDFKGLPLLFELELN